MKIILILLWVIISTVVVGFKCYVWHCSSLIQKKIQPNPSEVGQQLCKRSQRIFGGAVLGFMAAFIIVYFGFPNIQWKYQVSLAIAIGLLPGLLVGIAIQSKKRNKK